MTVVMRMMWKDWGFSSALFRQGELFLAQARQTTDAFTREGYIRASIVFFLMAFEAYLGDAVRAYIAQHRTNISPADLQAVEDEMRKRSGRIGEATRIWARRLTGTPLNTATKAYQYFRHLLRYRNALVHGSITATIPGLGKLAQEMETVQYAELARDTVAEMIKTLATHFRQPVPAWIP